MNLESTQANPDHSDCPICNERNKISQWKVIFPSITIHAKDREEAQHMLQEMIDDMKLDPTGIEEV